MTSVTTPGSAVAERPEARSVDPSGPRWRAPRVRRVRRDLSWAFTAAAATAGWRVGLRPLSDNSLFVHLVTGREIVRAGLARTDPYSFTAAGRPWVLQSWLVELLYGWLDAAFGPVGIRVAVGALGALLFGGMYRLALRLSGDRLRAGGLFALALAPVVLLFNARPLAFGLLGLLAVVWCVEVPASWLGRHPLATLPVVFWLWGNSHGSFALGGLYVGLHVLGRWADGAPPWPRGRERSLLIGALLGAVAVLANPYGPRLVLFPVSLLGRAQVLRNVIEWRSPDFHTAGPALFALFASATVVAASRGRRPPRRDLVVAVPFVLLALWALRNIGLATIVLLPIAARALSVRSSPATVGRDPAGDGAERVGRGSGPDPLYALAAVALLAVVLTVSVLEQPDFDLRGYSTAALDAVEREGLIGRRMFTTDTNAAYVLLRFWPRQRVFMDDRYDMFPVAVSRDYDAVASGGPHWRAVLDRYRVQVVVWPSSRPTAQLLALDRGWRSVYRDRDWVVYAR